MGGFLSQVVSARKTIKSSFSRKKKSTQDSSSKVAPAATAQSFAPSQANQNPTSAAPAAEGIGQVERLTAVEAPLPLSTAVVESATRDKGDRDEMATDEDYMSFLDRANEDPNQGVSKKSSGKIQLKALDKDVDVSAALKSVVEEKYYVSDADEPFEVVVLKGAGKGLPEEETFAKLVQHPSPKDADVEILDVGEWDAQGQYKEVVEAVRKETKGSDVRVYRIVREGARVEYFVVGVEGGKLVGVKALAIES